MSAETSDLPEADDPFGKILAACLEALDTGQVREPRELLDRYPAFASQLAAFFADQDAVDQAAAPLRYATQGVQTTTLYPPESRSGPDANAGDLPLPANFGDYELRRVIGRGGMGVVYEAHQKSLNRVVALKMLQAGHRDSAADIRRFQREAEMIAGLDHPHIVPIYEIGEWRAGGVSPPVPYLCMKYINGGSLAQAVGRGQWTVSSGRRAAELVAQVARAVHHAHQRGILHRDLKPANILLVSGRVVSGPRRLSRHHSPLTTPMVTDFGLAKRLDAPDLTQSGAIVGTPAWMAPEQAEGKRDAITTATDVYGLGAVLYALLTGRAPFAGDSTLDILLQVRQCEPERPRQVNPGVNCDLEAVCLKCLEKEPGRRYASAADLADDLERWLAGEPTQARPIRRLVRLVRWSRRNPLIAGLTSATVLLLLIVFIGQAVSTFLVTAERAEAWRQRDEAKAKEALARERERDVRRHLYAADMRQAFESWRRGNFRVVRDLVARNEPQPDQEDLRGFEWYYLRHLDRATQPLVLDAHQGEVYRVVLSPDGRTLATAGADGTVALWDTTFWQVRATLRGHTQPVRSLVFLPDGKTLATAGGDGTVRWWDPATGTPRAVFPIPWKKGEPGDHFALFADGRLLAWSKEHDVYWCRVGTEEKPKSAATRSSPLTGLAFSRAGDRLVFWSFTGSLIAVDVTTGANTGAATMSRGITALAIDHHGLHSALGFMDGSLRLPVGDRRQSHDLLVRQHSGPLRCLAFSPDDTLLASAGDDSIVRVWDLRRGTLRNSFHGHTDSVKDVAFTPDGRSVVSAARDGTVRVWKLDHGRERFPLEGSLPPARHFALSADGRTLVLAGQDQAVRVVDAVSGQVRLTWRGHSDDVTAVALSPDGHTVATAGADHTIRLWDPVTGEERRTLTGDVERALAFSPDGRVLAAGVGRDVVRWEIATGRQLGVWKGHTAAVRCLAFSPDGRQVISGAADGTVRIWNAAVGQAFQPNGLAHRQAGKPDLLVWCEHQGAVNGVAFSPDSHRVAVSSEHNVLLGDANGQSTPRQLSKSGKLAVAFSPDGKLVVAADVGGYVHMWDVASGLERYVIRWLTSAVEELAFSADGRTLVLLQDDGAIRLLDRSHWRLNKLFGQSLRPATALAFSPDGRTLAVGGTDRQTDVVNNPKARIHNQRLFTGNREDLRLWDVATGREQAALLGDEPWGAFSLAFAPHGDMLAAGDGAGLVWRWDLASRHGLPPLYTSPEAHRNWIPWDFAKHWNVASRPTRKDPVRCCAYSPDGKLLAAAGEHGPVHLWDTATWQEQGTLPVPGGPLHLRFSPDGNTLAISDGDTVGLWDVAGRHLRQTLRGNLGRVDCLAYSHDGKLLAVGGISHVVQLWDLDHRRLTPLVGHLDQVTALAFSPDGRTLASGSGDQTVRLWTVATAQEIAVLEGHTGGVTALAFAPQGTFLASGGTAAAGTTGEVFLWPAPRTEGGR